MTSNGIFKFIIVVPGVVAERLLKVIFSIELLIQILIYEPARFQGYFIEQNVVPGVSAQEVPDQLAVEGLQGAADFLLVLPEGAAGQADYQVHYEEHEEGERWHEDYYPQDEGKVLVE